MTYENIKMLDLSKSADELNGSIDGLSQDYVFFFDEGATYDDDYIDKLLAALEENPEAAFAQGSLISRGKKYSLTKGKKGLRNAKEDFSAVTLCPAGALFRANALKEPGCRFPGEFKYCRDEVFMIGCFAARPCWYLVSGAGYQMVLELDEVSNRIAASYVKEWYTESTISLLDAICALFPAGQLPSFAQFALLYITVPRFNANKGNTLKMVFEGTEERDAYLADVGKVMDRVSDDVLFAASEAIAFRPYERMFLGKLRQNEDETSYEVRLGKGGKKVRLYAKGSSDASPIVDFESQRISLITLKLEERDGFIGLYTDVRTDFCFPHDTYELFFVNESEDGEKITVPLEYTQRLGGLITLFDTAAFRRGSYRAFIPLSKQQKKQKIRLYANVAGKTLRLNYDMMDVWQNKLYNSAYSYWSIPGYTVSWSKTGIVITPEGRIGKVIRELKYLRYLKHNEKVPPEVYKWRLEYWKTYSKFKNKKIWCYYDKAYKSGDNGEYAYKYAAKQNDGIEKVFIIEPDCPDGKRLVADGVKVVKPGTMEAIMYALHADIIFMTHLPAFGRFGLGKGQLKYFKGLLKAKVIRMYHGYPIALAAAYTETDSDAAGVVVGTRYEIDLYTNSDNAYPESKVIKCGNPRYDDLTSRDKKQIMIAPTWRPSLAGGTGANGAPLYNPAFKDSYFFEAYNSLLHDEKLLDTARKHGYEIVLYMHPRLSAQTVDFEQNDVVKAFSCVEGLGYVDMMSDSSLMVTDYSSVNFDFAYMRKPVVYYHDPALPYWRTIMYDYVNDGFGEVCESPAELADVLCRYIENDCALSDYYRNRMEEQFLFDDDKSSERLYNAAKAMM